MSSSTIKSVLKLKALKLADSNVGKYLPTSEIEELLEITPNQRRRLLYSLKCDNLLEYTLTPNGYLINSVSPSVQCICRNAIECQHFNTECTEQGCCVLPFFKEDSCNKK